MIRCYYSKLHWPDMAQQPAAAAAISTLVYWVPHSDSSEFRGFPQTPPFRLDGALFFSDLWGIQTISGWWFGTYFFSTYWEIHHPTWLIFFRGVETINQINSQNLWLFLFWFKAWPSTSVRGRVWQGDFLVGSQMSRETPCFMGKLTIHGHFQ